MNRQNTLIQTLRKLAALLLCAALLTGAAGRALAAAGEEGLTYLYTFTPGEALSGEGMQRIRELLEALQPELCARSGEAEAGQVSLLSYGKRVLILTGENGADGTYSLYCSLMGDCTLQCRKEQLPDFLRTVVQALADMGILKSDNLERMQGLAARAGRTVTEIAETDPAERPDTGIDLSPYLQKLEGRASARQEETLPADNPEAPGAVKKTTYRLTEEDLKALADSALTKLSTVSVLGNEIKKGSLMIGGQVITEGFLRELAAGMQGETVLSLYENPDGRLNRLCLNTPEVSGIAQAPVFGQTRGLDLTIRREEGADGSLTSISELKLIGPESSLLTVRLDRRPGGEFHPMPTKKVHQVGGMSSQELLELIRSLRLTLAGNLLNLVLELPKAVFDLLIEKLF